jgi:hypothetical protein
MVVEYPTQAGLDLIIALTLARDRVQTGGRIFEKQDERKLGVTLRSCLRCRRASDREVCLKPIWLVFI